jgi:hypothetical protein
MLLKINPEWKQKIKTALEAKEPLSEILTYKPAIAWLIAECVKRDITYSFKKYDAGVCKITINKVDYPA